MTQKEFTDRTGIVPTPEGFDYIHALYMETLMDKDKFCKDFKKYGESAIMEEVHVRAVNYRLECDRKQSQMEDLVDFLIGKACAYKDTDFYRQAVKIVGQKEVTRRKLEMDLPLWDEDKEYIKNNLK